MSMRIHTCPAAALSMSVLGAEELSELYGEEFSDVGPALVLEDTGNLEAFVLTGDAPQWARLADDINLTVRAAACPDDAPVPYLSHDAALLIVERLDENSLDRHDTLSSTEVAGLRALCEQALGRD